MTINDLERLRDVSQENQNSVSVIFDLLANIFLLFDNNPPPLIRQYVEEIVELLESVKSVGKASGALPADRTFPSS